MADFTIKIDTDQIATIVWDCTETPFNILNFEAIKLLDSLVDEVLLDDNIIGAIITSAKPDFAAGMDLKVLADLKQDDHYINIYLVKNFILNNIYNKDESIKMD